MIYEKTKSLLLDKYPNYSPLWDIAEREAGESWKGEFSTHIERVFGPNGENGLKEAVDGYAEFCTEAIRAQIFFEKHSRYQATNYDEVLQQCYHSVDYMDRRYLPGQFLSHYVWPHHRQMLRSFVNDFLPKISAEVSRFYEVGVGCGMYSLKTLEAIPQASGIGFDISDFALNFTMRVVESHGFGGRYEIQNRDIIASPVEPPCDFVVSQEVLEHLEDPPSFIEALRSMTREGGYGYITAAINAGHTDHIYLYRSPQEVESQITEAGWTVMDSHVESNYPDKPEQLRPTVAGFLVRNR